MFKAHYQPDPRIPGMGLAFELGSEGGHRTVGKTGIVSGFHTAMSMAPDDGVGVFVLANTGGLTGSGVAAPLAAALLRQLLGLVGDGLRTDLQARPDVWGKVCGWYSPDPGPVTNLPVRVAFGAGLEVRSRGGHVELKPLTPVPGMRGGLRLYRDDEDGPLVFRVVSPQSGTAIPVVFAGFDGGQTAPRLVSELFSFQKRPNARNPRR